jgi:hypothetical protein
MGKSGDAVCVAVTTSSLSPSRAMKLVGYIAQPWLCSLRVTPSPTFAFSTGSVSAWHATRHLIIMLVRVLELMVVASAIGLLKSGCPNFPVHVSSAGHNRGIFIQHTLSSADMLHLNAFSVCLKVTVRLIFD